MARFSDAVAKTAECGSLRIQTTLSLGLYLAYGYVDIVTRTFGQLSTQSFIAEQVIEEFRELHPGERQYQLALPTDGS